MMRIASVLVLVALGTGAARAEDQLLPGRKLTLKAGRGGGKALFVAKAPLTVFPAKGSSADPSFVGSTFRIVNPVTGENALFDLPPASWSVNKSGTVFKLSNRSAPGGPTPARIALLKQKKGLKVLARAAGITLDEPTQGSIGIILTTGTNRYCALFGGTVKRDQPGRFVAKNAPPPAECPDDSLCGNDRLDLDEECEAGTTCAPGEDCVNCHCVGTGDVGLALTWGNGNDVDLHVTDPSGEEIFYNHPMSASGGSLDQDANRNCTGTATSPVENVFWPPGGAPPGTYTVRIVLYAQCAGFPLETPFTLRVVKDGIESEHSGVLTTENRCQTPCDACNCTTVTTFTRE